MILVFMLVLVAGLMIEGLSSGNGQRDSMFVYMRIVQGVSIFAMIGVGPFSGISLIPNVFMPKLITGCLADGYWNEISVHNIIWWMIAVFSSANMLFSAVQSIRLVHSQVVGLYQTSKLAQECDVVDRK